MIGSTSHLIYTTTRPHSTLWCQHSLTLSLLPMRLCWEWGVSGGLCNILRKTSFGEPPSHQQCNKRCLRTTTRLAPLLTARWNWQLLSRVVPWLPCPHRIPAPIFSLRRITPPPVPGYRRDRQLHSPHQPTSCITSPSCAAFAPLLLTLVTHRAPLTTLLIVVLVCFTFLMNNFYLI